MTDLDWVVKNWDFLSARYIRNIRNVTELIRQPQAPTTGKFYGTPDVFMDYGSLTATSPSGNKKMLLRPYIVAPMPDGIKAVYIDPKRYKFDDAGNITALATTYEFPIFVLR